MEETTKMKTGKHYYSLLTRKEQSNFKKACKEQWVNFDNAMTRGYNDLFGFIRVNLTWLNTDQSYEYWETIAFSNRTEPPKENHLAQFKRMVLYLFIAFVAICLLMAVHTVSYRQGYDTGYHHGIEKVDSIVNYEELTPESVEAVQEMQLNTVRINENRPKDGN